MSNKPFSERELEDLLDRHGVDPKHWPQRDQEPATRLLENSPTAQALLADARQLQAALQTLPTPTTPVGLHGRIVANAQPRLAWLDWLTTNAWRPASLACVPLLLGFVLGSGVAEDTADLEDSVLVAFTDADFADYELPTGVGGDDGAEGVGDER